MSGPFAVAIRERVRQARTALEVARQNDDVEGLLIAEGEWEDLVRLARDNGVRIDPDDEASA
ncbi:hypothetical protein [Nonomuraea glycinis]|uniref:hypothetical protein n=1 Tax=Nonomuraea glycinis TaxID=2047744 RepID=UPI002E0F580A|nr:hypothetical protein OHA68_36500 [Nonomuraea glycinis]